MKLISYFFQKFILSVCKISHFSCEDNELFMSCADDELMDLCPDLDGSFSTEIIEAAVPLLRTGV